MKSALPHRQRGVALITAVLIVALATILAVDVGFRGYMDQRRSATLFALDQSYLVALGAEAWAADTLRADLEDSDTDFPGENWATPIPPLPIDGGEIEGGLEDMQGRFNLNNLLTSDGIANKDAIEQLERILEALELETKWANMIVDWIDVDTVSSFPDGAEDDVYISQTPPYLAANMPITRTSEILALPQFGLERYQKLEPYITALPVGTPLNVCTAPGVVLDSLTSDVQQFVNAPEQLEKSRAELCFPNIKDLDNTFGEDPAYQKLKDANLLAETSSYFRASIFVSIGTTQLTLYSLLNRSSTGLVRPVLRSFGTP